MATCYNRYTRQYYYCQSRWNSWGRWVSLVVILLVAFLFFFLCACISQRRRRKAGKNPMYGTGWIPGGGQQTYNPQGQNYQAPPPQYNAPQGHPPQGGYNGQDQGYGANQSYFGGQRNDVEMGGQYSAPVGPPPSKVH